MSNITEFLLARIAEDEAAARDAILERHRVLGTVRGSVPEMTLRSWPDAGAPAVLVGPERVLAECEAKRRIVELHSGNAEWCGWTQGGDGVHGEWEDACDTLLALARPYAQHPDFDPAWRVS